MSGLFVTDEQIAEARQLAKEITDPIFDLISKNTTISVERTVLRWFGVDGTGNMGAPLVNLMCDRLKEAGVLNRGAAYWYGRALRLGATSPLDAVERLTALPLEKLAPLSDAEEKQLRDDVRAEARAAVEELKSRVHKRNEIKREFPMAAAPHKYVIVATGNIFDDVDQARAAAQAGADVIAVIRSTAQSLLDYVPQGATTEGYGGTYATQENFRIMREALDDESKKLKRYVELTNYSSGLCMAEIAFMAAWERLDMLLNDSMYGILFRAVVAIDSGFLSPLKPGVYNKVQRGQVVPVKISAGCDGVTASGLKPSIQLLSGDVDPSTDPGDGSIDVSTVSVSSADTTGVMRAVDGQYLYNLQVPIGPAGTKYTIRVRPTGSAAGGALYIVIQLR